MAVLIADDHEFVRRGIRALLAARTEFEVCGEAATGREAVALAARLRPGIVILDLSLPDVSGTEVAREIRKTLPETEILILTIHDAPHVVREVLASGARGYVVKGEAAADLLAALEALVAHRTFLGRRASEVVIQSFVDGTPPRAPGRLTDREAEVLRLVAAGLTSKEIAERLGIGLKTVEGHRSRLLRKLGTRSTTELIHRAVRLGLVKVDEPDPV